MARTLTPAAAKVAKIDTSKEKDCPKCGDSGTIEEKFGTRQVGQRFYAQSYCFSCRNPSAASSGKVGQPKPKLPPIAIKPVAVMPIQAAPKSGVESNELAKAAVQELYTKHFPGDKTGLQGKRSMNFMTSKLRKKLAV